MATLLLTSCPSTYARCTTRTKQRAKPSLGARAAVIAVAAAAIYTMFSGERWMLEHSPPATNAMIVATCAVDAVFGDAEVVDACTPAQAYDAEENRQ